MEAKKLQQKQDRVKPEEEEVTIGQGSSEGREKILIFFYRFSFYCYVVIIVWRAYVRGRIYDYEF